MKSIPAVSKPSPRFSSISLQPFREIKQKNWILSIFYEKKKEKESETKSICDQEWGFRSLENSQ